ncbi:MAG: radical SAM protein [Candidatus Helarchaeota archaeon]
MRYKWWSRNPIDIEEKPCKSLLHPFTAHHSECPNRLVINPYVGCQHRCLYCYGTYFFFPNFFDVIQIKVNAPAILKKEIERYKKTHDFFPQVYLSPATDSYQPIERKYHITRQCVQILQDSGISYYIMSKSDSMLADLELHAQYKRNCMGIWTITSLDEKRRKLFEPFAVSIKKRLLALERFSEAGITTAFRIDPILPFIDDSPEQLEAVVSTCAERGATHFTASILKLRPEIWNRIQSFFHKNSKLGLLEKYKTLYFDPPHKRGSYFYPKQNYREKILRSLQELAKKYKLSYGTCLEGMPHLNTGPCDGVRLPILKFKSFHQQILK